MVGAYQMKCMADNRIPEIEQAIAQNNAYIDQLQKSFDEWQNVVFRLGVDIGRMEKTIYLQLWGVFADYPFYFQTKEAAEQSLRELCEREQTYRLDQMERGTQLYYCINTKRKNLHAALEEARIASRQAVHSLTDSVANESNIIKHAAWASLQQTSLF